MAIINASTGEIQNEQDLSAHTNFVGQLTNMLADAQNIGKQGVAGLQAQKSGLEVSQAGLGKISPNNPLAFLFNMAPNSAVASDQNSASTMFNPGIASIQGQQEVAQQGLKGFTEVVSAEQANTQTKIAAFQAMKNAGIGRYSTFIDPNTNQVYSFDSATNTYSDKFGNTVKDPTNGKPPTPHPLGNGVDWSSYNGSMDKDYEKKMDNSIAYIQKALPQGMDTVGADGLPVIDNFLKNNKATFTSSMISLAASQYDVDPINLLASIQHESVWGTSNIAKVDNNFGGIKYVGQNNATQGEPVRDGTGGNYAHFETPQIGLYEQAELIAMYTPGSKSNVVSSADGLPLTDLSTNQPYQPSIIAKGQLILSGAEGYTQALTELQHTYPNAPTIANSLATYLVSKDPRFKTAISDEYQNNLKTATSIVQPGISAANKIIGTVDSTGKGSVGGVVELYDKMVESSKTNAGYQTGLLGNLFGGTGYGVGEQKAFNRAITDIVSNVNNVLAAGNVGVTANNQTIDYLFPKDRNGNYTMDKSTLLQNLQQVQSFMDARYIALTANPFDNNPVKNTPISTTPITPSISTGNDYASYLKAIRLTK